MPIPRSLPAENYFLHNLEDWTALPLRRRGLQSEYQRFASPFHLVTIFDRTSGHCPGFQEARAEPYHLEPWQIRP